MAAYGASRALDLAAVLGPPIVTAIVTTALGILGLVVGDWRQRRTEAGRRKLALEDAGRQVAFAAEWWNARKLIADSAEAEKQATCRALAWLEEASALVADSKPPPVDSDSIEDDLRRLFLAYPMQRRAARFLRIAFYLCLSVVPIWVGPILDAAAKKEQHIDIKNHLIVILILLVLAVVLRFGASQTEKSRRAAGQPTFQRAFLMYRFNRPTARLVRIIFYIWATFAVFVVLGAFSGLWFRWAGWLIWIVGWAVFLRYWAASLELRDGGDVRRFDSFDVTGGKADVGGPLKTNEASAEPLP